MPVGGHAASTRSMSARYRMTDDRSRTLSFVVGTVALSRRIVMIGRPTNKDMRELVIGHRSHGYLALYRYVVELDTVFVLAVRSQQEAGYTEL